MYDAEGRAPGTEPEITCVTASLQVDYLKPTPMGVELRLRARVEELGARKAIVRLQPARRRRRDRARPRGGGAGQVKDGDVTAGDLTMKPEDSRILSNICSGFVMRFAK